MSQSVLGRLVRARKDASVELVRKIRRALSGESATLVVKHGGRMPLHLIFEVAVRVHEVRDYVVGQCGWDVKGIDVSVDGIHYNAADADEVLLAPYTEVVEFGAPPPQTIVVSAKQIEFRKKTSGHG